MQTLTSDILRKRLEESFPSVYTTLMSIIQGVALAALAMNLGPTRSPTGMEWARGIVSLGLLIVVTFEYMWFLGVFRWTPSALDVILPLLLGIAEIFVAESVANRTYWYGALVGVSLFGAAAWAHTRHRSPDLVFGTNLKARDLNRGALNRDISLGVAAACIGSLGIALAIWRPEDGRWEVPLMFVYSLIESAVLILDERFIRKLRKAYNLN